MNADEYNQQQLEQQEMQEEMGGQTYNEFAAEVWKRLSSVDVNKHTEKKGNFTYLSWCWAWTTLQENYPSSNYECLPTEYHEGEGGKTATVWIDLTVSGDKYDITRRMWLPVLNFQNKPVVNPDAMDIQNARMRCLVKAMAMFGLGSYIYSGEDLPKVDPKYKTLYSDAQLEAFNNAFNKGDGKTLFVIEQRVNQEVFGALTGTIQATPGKRDKGKRIEAFNLMIDEYTESLDHYVNAFNSPELTENIDNGYTKELVVELIEEPKEAIDYVVRQLSDVAKEVFEDINKEIEEK